MYVCSSMLGKYSTPTMALTSFNSLSPLLLPFKHKCVLLPLIAFVYSFRLRCVALVVFVCVFYAFFVKLFFDCVLIFNP